MNRLQDTIDQLKQDFVQALRSIATINDLENIRVIFAGRKGHLAQVLDEFKKLEPEQRRIYGPMIQELRIFMQQELERCESQFKSVSNTVCLDVTAYTPKRLHGSLHVYTQLIEQLENIFISLGFQIADGPEVETEQYNFEALNIPKDHPARDLQDTFWLTSPGLLLRTHTSSIQAHAMEHQKPPIALFAPGRVYRNEATDATHEFMFMQAECLYIDTGLSLAHLLATAELFLKRLFMKETLNIRVRPGYFPFVEPGLEIDMSCIFCTNGCSICKKTGWIELLGAGLVHPKVLAGSGIDPTRYTGFAFGVGLERLAMLMHNITDIRLFHSYNMRFLEQI